MQAKGQIFIVSAPSGSGKTTLLRKLLKEDARLRFSVSYTTRKPRGRERNGNEYFFVSETEFEAMIDRGQFLEHARVFGNYYGTSRQYVEECIAAGTDLLLDIDTDGAAQVRRQLPEAVTIFIMPPSFQALEQRLEQRHLDSAETIRQRLGLGEPGRRSINFDTTTTWWSTTCSAGPTTSFAQLSWRKDAVETDRLNRSKPS